MLWALINCILQLLYCRSGTQTQKGNWGITVNTALYSETSNSFAHKEMTSSPMLLVMQVRSNDRPTSSAGNICHIYLSYINSISCRWSAAATSGKSTARLFLKYVLSDLCLWAFTKTWANLPRAPSQYISLMHDPHMLFHACSTAYIALADCAKSLQPCLSTRGNHFICFGSLQLTSYHK